MIKLSTVKALYKVLSYNSGSTYSLSDLIPKGEIALNGQWRHNHTIFMNNTYVELRWRVRKVCAIIEQEKTVDLNAVENAIDMELSISNASCVEYSEIEGKQDAAKAGIKACGCNIKQGE